MYILDGKNDVFKRFGEQIDKTLYLTTPNKSWQTAHTATEPREPPKTQNVFQRSKKLISFYDLGGEPPVMQFILEKDEEVDSANSEKTTEEEAEDGEGEGGGGEFYKF